ncbi:MAG TPA: AmmeMemoRadiSam system protein B [Verrucomicrobiae bacterium]|jgi:AmmeMemoRadiSam system protein B|nr:AmmeMemoRadiSam system protein B [Verrucomicrobiae bacterium]
MEDHPLLRPVEAFPVQQDGKTYICLRDPAHFAETLVVTPVGYFLIAHFDGQHSLVDIQEAYAKRIGQILASEELQKLIEALDQNYFLYNQRFLDRQKEIVDEFRRQPVRAPAHVGGVYSDQPEQLKSQLLGHFKAANGPGEAKSNGARARPKAIVAPHIDFHRGGPCYAWAYKELIESPGADLYILLGTSHCAGESPFVATRKDFATPIGAVETDKTFVDRLQQAYQGDLFADEYLHRTEHSLEFQAVYLKYAAAEHARLTGEERPFKIVPILVTSFHANVRSRSLPEKDPRIGDFLKVLGDLAAKESRRVCFVAGVDLAHVGAQFGDRDPITPDFLKWVEAEDLKSIDKLTAADPEGFFQEIAKDEDRRRICGFSPLYSLAYLMQGGQGRLLKYDQAFTQETGSAVTFTSMVYD